MQAEYDCAGSARTGITRSHKVKATCVDWTHQKSIIRFDLVIYLLRSVFFFLQHVPFPHVKHELAWAHVSTFVCSKYVMYALNLWEPCHGCGWRLFPCWRFMIFFFPTSHLVCLFKSNKRTETDRSSADDRDGSWVGQRARTHTHTSTQARGQQMEEAPICCQCWSQARWAGPIGLIGGPLISNVLTDFEVHVWMQTMLFYFAWQSETSLGVVAQMPFFDGW